jgi:predicted nucleic acid-binding protein
MKVLFDTSVLISAMLPDHVHHGYSQPWLAQAKARTFDAVISAHTLAELYAVLTRLPRKPQISPAEALKLIQENVGTFATVPLSGADYLIVIDELAKIDVSGGAIYDGVIAKAAQLAQVDYLLTLNVNHFVRVWLAGLGRIASPLKTAPPSGS